MKKSKHREQHERPPPDVSKRLECYDVLRKMIVLKVRIYIMIIPIFAKKGTRKSDGGTFYSFITTLTKKDGTQVKASVHFRRTAKTPDPNECPMMICFDKKNANFVTREFDKTIETDSGTETKHIVDQRLWLSDWTAAGEYVDTSLDDFAESPDDANEMQDFDE